MIAAVIDNNTILRTGFYTILNKNFDGIEILEAESVTSFKENYGDVSPDLIVFAQQVEKDTKTQIMLLKNHYKSSALIVYNVTFDAKVIRDYFKLGVAGCVSRKMNEAEFLKCVHTVLDRKRFIGEDFQELILAEFFVAPQVSTIKSKTTLSPRENQIAAYLTEGRRTSWIAKKLERKQSTIATIKSNIFRKLKVDNVVDLNKYFSEPTSTR